MHALFSLSFILYLFPRDESCGREMNCFASLYAPVLISDFFPMAPFPVLYY